MDRAKGIWRYPGRGFDRHDRHDRHGHESYMYAHVVQPPWCRYFCPTQGGAGTERRVASADSEFYSEVTNDH